METPALSIQNATIGYMGVPVQSNISFDVPKGQILSILGGSGCGKSTLLKSMIGLLPVLSGDIQICGESIIHCPLSEKRRIMRRFGVAFQNGALFRSYTLAENIALPLREFTTYSNDEIDRIVQQKLTIVGLENAGNKMPGDLSGGMVKRGAVARAMALNPEILFLDEPSAGLDPLSSSNLDNLILNIRQQFNSTIILITHELKSIFAVSDRILFLDDQGRGVLADDTPENLRTSTQNPTIHRFLNGGKD